MVIAIAGAHGKIAMRLTRLLVGDGHRVLGLIRNPDHAPDLQREGASPVVCDLEAADAGEIAAEIRGADAAVFAAGAGAGSGAQRKLSMDRDGAIKLLEAARNAAIQRFVIVSSVGAEKPPEGDEVFSVYLQAKAAADEAVQNSDRDWTIVRPGRLTDDPGTGRVRIQSEPFRGQIARDDVASTLQRLLADSRASRRILYVNGGEEPIERALDQVLSAEAAPALE
jgi:nucleoside-diphosphate-sugar epimerase